MKPRDIFSLSTTKNHDAEIIKFAYWELELFLADENDATYSAIEYSDRETRECFLCGHVNHTDEFGNLPKQCQNKKCKMLWDYWQLGPFPVPCSIRSEKRIGFLKSRMKAIFNTEKLRLIPRALLYDFLLNAMIERIVHEKNN